MDDNAQVITGAKFDRQAATQCHSTLYI